MSAAEQATPAVADRLVSRSEIGSALLVGQEAIRRWMRSGKLPQPDVALSRKTLRWRLSTLQAAGINMV